jgi:hypothetical protein
MTIEPFGADVRLHRLREEDGRLPDLDELDLAGIAFRTDRKVADKVPGKRRRP